MFLRVLVILKLFFFFFNDTATTEIYTLSLHDALPIYRRGKSVRQHADSCQARRYRRKTHAHTANHKPYEPASRKRPRSSTDRKSTRLNSSHSQISYAVFCLKKKTIFELH